MIPGNIMAIKDNLDTVKLFYEGKLVISFEKAS